MNSAKLEVQDEGTGEWRSAGPIHLAKSTVSLPVRRQLSKQVKRCLAPDSNSKEDRRPYYLFRHAPGEAPNTNLLILLHGSGDTHLPFDKLAQTMKLPQTATLAISSLQFETLPFQLGYTWFQEMDYSTGEAYPRSHSRRLASIQKVVSKFTELLSLLLDDQWIIAERIFFMGYGAGASLIMELCQTWSEHSRPSFGGGICIGGGSARPVKEFTSKGTPILLLCGKKDDSFPESRANEAKEYYERACGDAMVQLHAQPNKGQAMISSAAEMKVVMTFLAPRLVRVSLMGTS